jgi:hypothetical protein
MTNREQDNKMNKPGQQQPGQQQQGGHHDQRQQQQDQRGGQGQQSGFEKKDKEMDRDKNRGGMGE